MIESLTLDHGPPPDRCIPSVLNRSADLLGTSSTWASRQHPSFSNTILNNDQCAEVIRGMCWVSKAQARASAPAATAAGLLASRSSMRAARRLRYVVPTGSRTCDQTKVLPAAEATPDCEHHSTQCSPLRCAPCASRLSIEWIPRTISRQVSAFIHNCRTA